MKNHAVEWIDRNSEIISQVNDQIWSFAEVGYQEYKSAELLKSKLQEKGFSITDNVAGIPTAFTASWGEGKPIIGFLAEYDALPQLSQKAEAKREALAEGEPGHGCSHNVLGAGILGGVLGLQQEMIKDDLPGTIVFYGCPAEELLSGKVFMAREGVFDDLDLALTWHPGQANIVLNASMLAQNQVKFTFKGITSHAAADPHNGRSALDAVELMNVGANYLREHIPDKGRVHYAITHGGGAPNIVPAYAQSWYYVRAPHREQVEDIYSRLLKIAEGAAMMTGTTVEVEFIAGCYDPLPNESIAKVLHTSMIEAGPIEWSDEDKCLARQIEQTIPAEMQSQLRYLLNLSEEDLDESGLVGKIPNQVLTVREAFPGSSDIGDVSRITPLALFGTTCSSINTPAHSWQQVAQAGSSIAHKGAVLAAKTLALAGSKYLRSPALVQEARDEFTASTKGKGYICPIPDDVKPNITLI